MADLPVLNVCGKPGLKDKTLIKKMTGSWDFAPDTLPGHKLWAHTKTSSIAMGKIKSIDTSAAEALPGVKAVMTYQDYSWWSDTITWMGQEVASVAAVDEETAMRAVELIKVEYDQGTAVVDVDEAMASGAPLTGIWADSNVRTTEILRGDYAAGFQEADVTVEDTIGWTNFYSHNCLEPRTVVAWWSGDNLYMHTTTQHPFGQRSAVSGYTILGEKHPLNKVHVLSHGSGAGHGDKSAGDWLPVAAVLAKKSGMAVAYHESRVEYLLTGSHQHKGKATIKLGAKSDGTLVSMDCTFYGDAAGNGATWAGGLSWPIRTTFKCPNARFTHVDIATNTPRTAAWRCVADPPGDVLMNPVLDQMAEKLNMDPLAFRVKNCVEPGSVHQDTDRPFAGIAPAECFQKAADAISWSSKYHAPGAKTMADGRLHGIAVSGHVDSHGQMSSPAGAIVNLDKDGTALCTHGQSHCAGTVNSCEHIVAETLGMNYEDIEVGEIGNTDVGSECGSEGGSKQTITLGSAFQRAAEDARDQAFDVAATQLNISKDKVAAKNGMVYEVGNETNSITWAALSAKFPHPIVGRGWSWPKELQRPLGDFPVGTPCETRGGAAQAIEVAVDPETGHVEVLNQANAVDTGRAIYLGACNKEIIGGMEIMQGEAIYYEQVIEKSTGATLNTGHLDHKYPTSLDIHPDAMTPVIVESDDKCGPYGAHGIGEPCVTSIGAFMSAVYNATGVWVKEYPLTPWKVLKALGKA